MREPEAFWRENEVAVVIVTSCSDNVVMAETNGQMSDVFFILQWEEVLNRLRKKESKMKLSWYVKKPFFLLVPIPSLQSSFSSNLKVRVFVDKTVHWHWENSSQREESEGRIL